MFTIGSFAELTGVSAKRLRHYDHIGLFVPAFVEPSSRYRYYTASQIPVLRRIVSLSALGVPLKEIRPLIGGGPGELEAALDRRRSELVAERAELDRKLAALEIELDARSQLDVVILERPAARWASLRRRLAEGADLSPMFIEAESVVIGQGRRARRPPVAVDHGLAGDQRDIEILIPTTGPVSETESVHNRTTAAAQVAATLVKGSYPELARASQLIGEWITDAGRRIGGPTWVVYLRFSAEPELELPHEFLTDRSDYVSEIQAELG